MSGGQSRSVLARFGLPVRCVAVALALGTFTSGAVLLWCDSAPREIASTSSPSRWFDDSGLFDVGFGSLAFEARDGNRLTARTYRAAGFDPSNGPIWFVLHGASRDVERYVRAAAPVAERYGALVIAPHFPAPLYPKSTDYTLGVYRRGLDGLTLMGPNRWRAPRDYLYAEIEHLFDASRGSLGGSQQGYFLFGHSAGAQFTHRLMTFLPEARVLGAVAANAGWYTMPSDDDPRYHTMPYGLIGSPIEPEQLGPFLASPFVVLLGERDTTTAATDRMVRGTPEADAQGLNRLERGEHYYDAAKSLARELDTNFGWRLAIVPRAPHDAASMLDSAGFLLFVPHETPCTASSADEADALVMTEVLADPPRGAEGDSNGDGERDPAGDEFVEIVNTGKTPVCLSGWALGDAARPERHVFPLGRALAPGETLVVFGGGVPTGAFDGAQVQWVEDGLSLSNDGDVITLRDRSDQVALEFSWGDCAGTSCAEDHFPGDLGIRQSIARRTGAEWVRHVEIDGERFSPGRTPDRSEP